MKVTLSLHICGCRFAHIPHTAWWGLAGSNRRPPACERACNVTFRLKRLFPPLFARKALLFRTLVSTASESSETVGGLLCGQQGFPQNNAHYTPLAFARGAIVFIRFFCLITTPCSSQNLRRSRQRTASKLSMQKFLRLIFNIIQNQP